VADAEGTFGADQHIQSQFSGGLNKDRRPSTEPANDGQLKVLHQEIQAMKE